MTPKKQTGLGELRRLPGLFRRWELPEVFQPNHLYQIEEAGEHADGAPLLAIFIHPCDAANPGHNIGEGA